MSDTIITVEHLSKRYKLGQIGATSLRESAEPLWHKLRGRDPDEHMGKVGTSQSAERRAQSAWRGKQSSGWLLCRHALCLRLTPCALRVNERNKRGI